MFNLMLNRTRDSSFWKSNRASGLCASTNISAADCLHLATALETGCDVLVSADEYFLKEARKYI